MAGIQPVTRQLIIPFVRDYKAYVLNHGNTEAKVMRPLSKKVFVVHGHDEGARESVARFLESLGFAPIILHEQANKGRTVIEKVEANSDVSFAVLLLTPDDEGCKKGGVPEPLARIERLKIEKRSNEREDLRKRITAMVEEAGFELKDLFGKGRRGGTMEVKYRDPSDPANTWTGGGRMPRWMAAATKSGRKKKEDFLV